MSAGCSPKCQRAQVVVDVARLSPLARVAGKAGPAERVAAGLRDDVEGRAAAVGLAEAARNGHLHFRGVRHVVQVPGHAATVAWRAHVHPVELDEAFGVPPAARREEVVDGRRAAPEAGGLNRRNGRDVVAIASRRRKRAHDVSVDDHLLARGLDVHHRRLAGHRDRLLEAAHSHLGANRHDAAARQLEAFAHDRGEAGQREGDLVGAGWQIGNAILPRCRR